MEEQDINKSDTQNEKETIDQGINEEKKEDTKINETVEPMTISTSDKNSIKNPFNKLRVIAVVFAIIIVLGGIGFYVLSKFSNNNSGPNNPSPTPQNSAQKLEKFKSEEEFKTYLQESDTKYQSFGMGMARMETSSFGAVESPQASDTINLGVPSGSGFSEQVYRVSETNVQVKGIDEPDILKSDGENIYYSIERGYYLPIRREPIEPVLFEEQIAPDSIPQYNTPNTKVLTAFPPEDLEELSEIEETGNFLLYKDTLVIFRQTDIVAYNVSDAANPVKKWTMEMDEKNSIATSRLMGDSIYLVATTYVSRYDPCIIPVARGISEINITCTDIYRPGMVVPTDSTYTVLKINPETGEVSNKTSFVGSSSSSVVYMSPNAVYVTYTIYEGELGVYLDFFIEEGGDIFPTELIERLKKIKEYDISLESKYMEFETIMEEYYNSLTRDEELKLQNDLENKLEEYISKRSRDLVQSGIAKIDINSFEVTSSSVFPGQPLNQFSLDEYQGYLRIATTVGGGMFGSETSANDVYVLDSSLNTVGKVLDMGLTERIYSVRFIQDKGYIVTFRQIDPFYVLDLSDPTSPKLSGELKIPGYSSYLHPIDKDRILGVGKEDNNVKISLFNVSNAQNPLEVAKYTLDEYYSDILNTHHAFMIDYENEVFFLPGNQGGYIFSYANNTLSLKRTVADMTAKRALYINNYLYIAGDDKIVVLDMQDWEEINRLNF